MGGEVRRSPVRRRLAEQDGQRVLGRLPALALGGELRLVLGQLAFDPGDVGVRGAAGGVRPLDHVQSAWSFATTSSNSSICRLASAMVNAWATTWPVSVR